MAFATGFVFALALTATAGLAVAFLLGVTGLAAGLEAPLGAAFLTSGLPLATTLVTADLTALAGVGLLSFLAGATDLALALDAVLDFFTAVFELVLRGFFTSCLLAVAAYVPFKAPAICK
ncbi:MAG: hypothetical protein EB085_03005 [Betaproteobacteria bacterium]|nr:hypothetical protein [Betaproteobacteria bacterium]